MVNAQRVFMQTEQDQSLSQSASCECVMWNSELVHVVHLIRLTRPLQPCHQYFKRCAAADVTWDAELLYVIAVAVTVCITQSNGPDVPTDILMAKEEDKQSLLDRVSKNCASVLLDNMYDWTMESLQLAPRVDVR
jgi:hypothetical protein